MLLDELIFLFNRALPLHLLVRVLATTAAFEPLPNTESLLVLTTRRSGLSSTELIHSVLHQELERKQSQMIAFLLADTFKFFTVLSKQTRQKKRRWSSFEARHDCENFLLEDQNFTILTNYK